MSKIRDTLVATSEKKFLLKALAESTRLDGRAFQEFRQLGIEFGKEWGCCYVSLGKTRVLAQTSCEIQQPKSSRPSEGILNINLELNPLAAPHFEAGRQSELSVQLNRLLEKCLKDSKAVDLESLCIKTSEKVWALRVDLNVINHEGNILDCASIALLASLTHFRRPDVTCNGEEFIIHSYKKRDPIPTVIHHYPICATFAIFNGGEFILADPNLLEEGVADAFLTVGLNGFKELCGLHLGGKAELTPDLILQTMNRSISQANTVIEEIKKSIKIDEETRKNQHVGFHIQANVQTSIVASLENCLDQWRVKPKRKFKKEIFEIDEIAKGTASVFKKETFMVVSSDEDNVVVEVPNRKRKVESIEIFGSDSDDDVVIL